MTWREFQERPDLEFEFFLAEQLGKTVAELRTGEPQPLSNDEFMRWAIFYGRRRQREQLEAQKAG